MVWGKPPMPFACQAPSRSPRSAALPNGGAFFPVACVTGMRAVDARAGKAGVGLDRGLPSPQQLDSTARVRVFGPQLRLEPLRAWKPAVRWGVDQSNPLTPRPACAAKARPSPRWYLFNVPTGCLPFSESMSQTLSTRYGLDRVSDEVFDKGSVVPGRSARNIRICPGRPTLSRVNCSNMGQGIAVLRGVAFATLRNSGGIRSG